MKCMCLSINHGKSSFTIEPNMRIAQMLVLPLPAVEITEVSELEETCAEAAGLGIQDIEERQNSECRLQNEDGRKLGSLNLPSFCILQSSFCNYYSWNVHTSGVGFVFS